MSVWFLPKNLASLWFPEVSYTCTVVSNLCSRALYCMNPRAEHDYVHSWRQGHRLPCCGELCTEEAQHPTWALIPWASHLTRRTTFLGYLLSIRHSVTREHPATPQESDVLSLCPHLPYFTFSLAHFHFSSAVLTTVVSSSTGQESAEQSLKPSRIMILAYLFQGPKHVCCLAILTVRRSTARRCGNCFQDQTCQCGKKIRNSR